MSFKKVERRYVGIPESRILSATTDEQKDEWLGLIMSQTELYHVALSRSGLGKFCCVYFAIKNESIDQIKIGFSTNAGQRIKGLSSQVQAPILFIAVAQAPHDENQKYPVTNWHLEHLLHWKFKKFHKGHEWYNGLAILSLLEQPIWKQEYLLNDNGIFDFQEEWRFRISTKGKTA